MSEKSAKAISFIFHPVFLVFYVTLVLIFSSYFSVTFETVQQKILISGMVLLPATILPCLFILILKRFKIIQSFEMNSNQERCVPYVFNILIYTLIFFILQHNFENLFLKLFFIGLLILQIIIFIINFFWKISVHSAGIGAITGFFMAVCINFSNLWIIVSVLLMLSSVIIFARLRLKAHTIMQAISGWVLGFLINYLLILTYSIL